MSNQKFVDGDVILLNVFRMSNQKFVDGDVILLNVFLDLIL